jgi:hypothetical protein
MQKIRPEAALLTLLPRESYRPGNDPHLRQYHLIRTTVRANRMKLSEKITCKSNKSSGNRHPKSCNNQPANLEGAFKHLLSLIRTALSHKSLLNSQPRHWNRIWRGFVNITEVLQCHKPHPPQWKRRQIQKLNHFLKSLFESQKSDIRLPLTHDLKFHRFWSNSPENAIEVLAEPIGHGRVDCLIVDVTEPALH